MRVGAATSGSGVGRALTRGVSTAASISKSPRVPERPTMGHLRSSSSTGLAHVSGLPSGPFGDVFFCLRLVRTRAAMVNVSAGIVR